MSYHKGYEKKYVTVVIEASSGFRAGDIAQKLIFSGPNVNVLAFTTTARPPAVADLRAMCAEAARTASDGVATTGEPGDAGSPPAAPPAVRADGATEEPQDPAALQAEVDRNLALTDLGRRVLAARAGVAAPAPAAK